MAEPHIAPLVARPDELASSAPTVSYPPVPDTYARGWGALIRVVGPGAIMASVTVGTGETIFSPRLGAIFGYDMLWTVLAAVIFKGVLVYTGGRHLVLTGEHPMQAWARFPGPRRWVPMVIGLITIVSFPFWVAALTGALASLCVWATGYGTLAAWSTWLVATAMLLSVVQTYRVVEKVSTGFLAMKVLLIFVAIVVVSPDWSSILRGLFVPTLPAYEAWVQASYPTIADQLPLFQAAVFLGVVGGGVQDYIGYVSFMREKRWGLSSLNGGEPARLPTSAEQVAQGRAWLRAPLLDVAFSFASVLVMTGCFMILGAAILHPQMQVPTDADLYSKQAQFLGLLHPWLINVYKAGIFIAIFAAIYGTFEVYTRSAYEPLRAVFPGVEWRIPSLRLWVTLFSGLGALVLIWSERKTVGLVELISPFTGVLGSGLWCLAMVYVDRVQMPAAYRMRKGLLVLTVFTGLTMALLGGYTALRKWAPGLIP